ncbi:MAG TPA: RNA polymerase factor sigma-54, partial [Kofleriaceae bacterium]|nr:RNA polymerase factor sigma-54 [Kofleriaceae bacterium]
NLYDHLTWQLKMGDLTPRQIELGLALIGNIDADGYIKDPPLCEISAEEDCTEEELEIVLETIQSFDPIGVGARSLAECLLIQAIALGQDDDLVVHIIKDHLSNLEKKNYQAIARDLKEPIEEIYEAAKVIMDFDPRPGKQYAADEPQYITPDVYIHKVGDKFFVVPNDDGLPKLKISSFYRSAMGNSNGAKEYIQDKLRSAQWLIRSIQQRQRTIIKVSESILKFQREFFEKGIAHLKPLILRDVAEDIGMHESTISRVTTNKYVHTPQGIFELKFFFNSGISRTNGDDLASQAVKSKIKILIGEENPKKPYSDQKIVEMLKKTGIDIARRTVAKYREQMGILSSSKRKQLF